MVGRSTFVVALWVVAAALPASAAELRLLGPENFPFGYTFDAWQASYSPTSVRLTDNTPDGWGGAGSPRTPAIDLSGFADGRLQVEFQTEALNLADAFTIELYDASNRSGKWTFPARNAPIGTPQTRVSATTLRAPTSGVGDFANLDLSRITNVQLLGEFGSPARFDMSFRSVIASTDLAPPPPYAGSEANAPWRAVAAQRIESVRKADLAVRVVDALGNPVPNAAVTVQQQRHEFGFGSAVQAFRLRDNDPQHARYKAEVERLFNVATIENNLKWPAFEGEWGDLWTRDGADRALDWIVDRGIEARGHVMVWPGADNLPSDLRNAFNGNAPLPSFEALRARIAARIADVGGFGSGRIAAWDVVNEPRANHDVMDYLPEGDAAMAEWFRLARQADPNAQLYLNEFDILASGGGTDTANQRLLQSQALAIRAAGGPITGVGLQGHFREDNLTGPEQLWEIVDRYADADLNVQVTEFDFGTQDEQLQAAYLRDFFTAMFAHEGVSDLVMWGFWESAHFDPQRALFRTDWSAKPAGEAYLDLVFDQWWTDEAVAADAAGTATVRAFKGVQRATATFGGESATSDKTLSTGGATVTLTLAMVQGDFNRDGRVDAADYTLWRDTFDQTVEAPGLGADGDGDGRIGEGDRAVWRANFGALLPQPLSIPEPAAAVLVGAAALAHARGR